MINHDWEQIGWEYDDSFFKCRHCHLKTARRRGYPARTPQECLEEDLLPCKE